VQHICFAHLELRWKIAEMKSVGQGDNVRDVVVRAVADLYDALDHELSSIAPECRACGDCCDFRKHSHRVYLSLPELLYIEKCWADSSAKIRAENLAEGLCPFWIEGRCSNHEGRPLSCRLHFCAPEFRETSGGLYEKYLRALKGLCRRFGLSWSYRDLVETLREGSDMKGAPAES